MMIMIVLRRKRGTALLEFVLMLPFYATCLFGALEFGQIFQERVQLTNACAEGVRACSSGESLSEIRNITKGTVSSLGITDEQISIEYNSSEDGTGDWVAASDDGSDNTIPIGYPCRVRITNWPHVMLTGTFFSWVPNVSGSNFYMGATETMMRGSFSFSVI